MLIGPSTLKQLHNSQTLLRKQDDMLHDTSTIDTTIMSNDQLKTYVSTELEDVCLVNDLTIEWAPSAIPGSAAQGVIWVNTNGRITNKEHGAHWEVRVQARFAPKQGMGAMTITPRTIRRLRP